MINEPHVLPWVALGRLHFASESWTFCPCHRHDCSPQSCVLTAAAFYLTKRDEPDSLHWLGCSWTVSTLSSSITLRLRNIRGRHSSSCSSWRRRSPTPRQPAPERHNSLSKPRRSARSRLYLVRSVAFSPPELCFACIHCPQRFLCLLLQSNKSNLHSFTTTYIYI